MLHEITNGTLTALIAEDGAELKSLKDPTGLEWMWQADPAHWARTSPVLFPFVGKLQQNQYLHQGKTYPMTSHGFARDRRFVVEKINESGIRFTLEADKESWKIYPFEFVLKLTYKIVGNELITEYQVENKGDDQMFFSIGGHPGFRCPLNDGESFGDYYLEFEKLEPGLERWMVEGPFLSNKKEKLVLDGKKLSLKENLFGDKDAVILRNTNSSLLKFASKKHERNLVFKYDKFQWMAIWSKGPFLCLEPWHGIADEVGFEGELKNKLSIRQLMPGGIFNCKWSVAIN